MQVESLAFLPTEKVSSFIIWPATKGPPHFLLTLATRSNGSPGRSHWSHTQPSQAGSLATYMHLYRVGCQHTYYHTYHTYHTYVPTQPCIYADIHGRHLSVRFLLDEEHQPKKTHSMLYPANYGYEYRGLVGNTSLSQMDFHRPEVSFLRSAVKPLIDGYSHTTWSCHGNMGYTNVGRPEWQSLGLSV